MSDHQRLSSEAVQFLLELLELPEPFLSAAAAELRVEPTAYLIRSGLLASHGYDDVAASGDDYDDAPLSIAWSEELGGMAYFSPAAGLVAVPASALERRRVDVPLVLTAIAVDLDLPRGQAAFELIPGLLWEIGDVRIGKRSARDPIWFARRLWDPAVQRQIAEAARSRPHTRQRVILTSSSGDRVGDFAISGTVVVALHDVLARPDGLAVSVPILSARLGGVPARPDHGPVVLSADGTRLAIGGGPEIFFKSATQIVAIKYLVAAFKDGRRVAVAEFAANGNPSRLFGTKKWALLAPYLKSRNGLWGFDL